MTAMAWFVISFGTIMAFWSTLMLVRDEEYQWNAGQFTVITLTVVHSVCSVVLASMAIAGRLQ